MAFLAGRPTAPAPNWNPAPALKSLAGRFVSVSGAESFGPADESGDSHGNVTPCPGRRAAAQRPTRQKAPFPRFCLLINLLIQRVARPRLTWPSAPPIRTSPGLRDRLAATPQRASHGQQNAYRRLASRRDEGSRRPR